MSTSESSSPLLTRRGFLNFAALGTASVAVSACVTTAPPPLAPPPAPTYQEPPEADYATMYGPISDGGFDVPAVPYQKIDPRERSSSIQATTSSTSCSLADRRYATASGSAVPASPGPAMPSCSGSRGGRNGRRQTK